MNNSRNPRMDDDDRGRKGVSAIRPVPPWPSEELESVPACPVCGSGDRELLHSELTDRVFHIADGQWNLYRCSSCESGYLDPRPTKDSIGKAYAGYYTHEAVDHPLVRRKGFVRTQLHDCVNDYQNHRYGLQRRPGRIGGRWLLLFFPPLRHAADAECRHLPPLPESGMGRLLDVGCGNGSFLELAGQAGWTAEGLDFDSEAVKVAQARGLNVHKGGVDVLTERRGFYDFITLCHVIEHVHDPVALLNQLRDLLKPGGILWIDTPNLSSFGARLFRGAWRGLEPPRHLTLFNSSSLRKALKQSGFRSLKQHWRGLTVFNVFAASQSIASAGSAASASYRGKPPVWTIMFELLEMMIPARREFLTFTARK